MSDKNQRKSPVSSDQKTLSVFAPAKINLYLHITGRLDNGYHTLDSLIGFADIGDRITISQAEELQFSITGGFASIFDEKERDCSPDSSNLVIRAVWALSHALRKPPNLAITLEKNLPLAAGVGGGSSDAAAVLWGLIQWWKISPTLPFMVDLMLELGADVPVCFSCQPSRIRGIGELINPVANLPEIPIVLINEGYACPTLRVFAHYAGPLRDSLSLPKTLDQKNQLVDFLREQHNDLSEAAFELIPSLRPLLNDISAQKGCTLARMSGSGATLFGLFDDPDNAAQAAQTLSSLHPDAWIQTGWLNRPHRY